MHDKWPSPTCLIGTWEYSFRKKYFFKLPMYAFCAVFILRIKNKTALYNIYQLPGKILPHRMISFSNSKICQFSWLCPLYKKNTFIVSKTDQIWKNTEGKIVHFYHSNFLQNPYLGTFSLALLSYYSL